MSNKFYKAYAKYYDIINRDKKYIKESRFLDKLFKRFKNINTVLDVGCGTATHALLLEKMGYNIFGADISQEMLKIAKNKIKKAKSNIKIIKQDMRNLKFRQKFDAVVCMFHTLNHLPTNKDILNAIESSHIVLKNKGIYVIDMGQFKIKKSKEELTVQDSYKSKKLMFLVAAHHHYNSKSQLQQTKWIYIIKQKNKISCNVSGIVNTKAVSFTEIKNMLSKAGFRLLSSHNDYNINSNFNPRKDRHMILICQKI